MPLNCTCVLDLQPDFAVIGGVTTVAASPSFAQQTFQATYNVAPLCSGPCNNTDVFPEWSVVTTKKTPPEAPDVQVRDDGIAKDGPQCTVIFPKDAFLRYTLTLSLHVDCRKQIGSLIEKRPHGPDITIRLFQTSEPQPAAQVTLSGNYSTTPI
jgi:hypothetical protein